jgi:signal transduction histidine kinase/ligand-binding sensor domain-containing protein
MKKTLIILLFAVDIFAQNQTPLNYTLSKLTADDGLSQVSNYFRYEDSRGFMWITANDALNRYDGSSVKVYNLNRYFKNCPNLQQGYGFAEDDRSNVYVGSERGLYIYTRNTDKFTLQKIFKNAPDDVAMPFAYANGKIWCYNRFYQLATFDVETKEVKLEASTNLDPINSVHIYQIINNIFYYRWPVLDKFGNVWLVGKNKVITYNINSKHIKSLITTKKTDLQNEFYCSFFDKTNRILNIGTNNGILRYNAKNEQIENIISINGKNIENTFAITGNTDKIIFNSTAGFAIASNDLGQIHFLANPFNKNYLSQFQFSFDKSGRCWITNDGVGQEIYSFKPNLLNRIPFEIYHLPVSTITELPNKDILFHSRLVFNKAKGNYYKLKEGLVNNQFYWTKSDTARKGNWFFIGASAVNEGVQNGLFFRNEAGQFKSLIDNPSNYKNLGQQQDLAVLSDRNVIISFSTGLYWLNEKFKKLELANNMSGAFKINVLSKNRIAVSYLNKDMILFQINPDRSLTQIQTILPKVQSFYVSENPKTNQYWVGTNKGVYLLDQTFKSIKHFDSNNGLAGTYIYGLLLDDDGNAWCSHQRGLSSIDAKDFNLINYDKADGIQDWDFNNRSFLKGSDGTLYFGGVNGANYFKPPLKQNNFYHAELYVDEIWVDNQTYKPEINANSVKTIELPYQANNLALRVIVKDLEFGKNRQIIYRLKNTDTQWNHLPPDSKIVFNSLESGSYVLELGVYDKFTHQKKASKTIKITIDTPFYNRVFFWLFLGGITTALLFVLLNRRKLRLQRTQFEQQLALEKQRNKITADLHDDIGASLSSLQVNSVVANQLMDKDIIKAKIVLEKIELQAKNVADKMGDIIWSMKPGKDEFMSISSRIKNFANDIMGSTNIDFKVHVQKEVDLKIKDITTRKNIVFISKEALNNSVKYSKATKVWIDLEIISNTIILKIEDNGVGFESSEIKGNGIANMEKRTEELQGTFSMKNSKNKGTTVFCEIPLVP